MYKHLLIATDGSPASARPETSATILDGVKRAPMRREAGRLVISIPRAMRLYAIRRWGLDRPMTRLEISDEDAGRLADDGKA